MSGMIVTLDRLKNESVSDYDNRINMMKPLCVGKAYFRSINYDASKHLFSVFIVWNDINNRLLDPMPSGGFQIHCSEDDAKLFCKSFYGYDVFARLIAVDGDIYFKDIYVFAGDKRLVVSFTGRKTIEPDFIPQLPEDAEARGIIVNPFATRQTKKISDNSSFCVGSFNVGSFNVGSFNIGSFNVGSFNAGSFSLGSFNIGSFNVGSFNVGSFSLGSFNVGAFNVGSFSLGSFNVNSFNICSFNVSSFNLGSYNIFSAGSATAGLYGSCMAMNVSDIPYFDLLKEIFGIGMLGYGLDNL